MRWVAKLSKFSPASTKIASPSQTNKKKEKNYCWIHNLLAALNQHTCCPDNRFCWSVMLLSCLLYMCTNDPGRIVQKKIGISKCGWQQHTLFPHSAQTKHGISDSMGATGKQTTSSSIAWIGSAERFFKIWIIALVGSVWNSESKNMISLFNHP